MDQMSVQILFLKRKKHNIFISKIFHSDYFSGWDESELQTVLDNCDNYSEAAMPDAFCSDWLTFRGKGKTEGVQVDDTEISEDLQKIQPEPVDIKGTISPEEVTDVNEVPRGTCTGTLLPYTGTSAGLTCTRNTKKTVKVEKGKSYTFQTNDGNRYGPNMKCNLTYKKEKDCKKMKLSCDQFSLGAGDMMRVKAGKSKQV